MMRQRLSPFFVLALAPALMCGAQVITPAGTYPNTAPAPPVPPRTAPPASAAETATGQSARTPASLLDQASNPAQVSLADGKLSVTANNSSLLDILHQIATNSGMKIEGYSKDQRVFGAYGPGAPREVILSLLEGSGYNVIMVGATPKGAPKRLELSTRGQVSAPPSQPSIQAAGSDDDDTGSDDNQLTPSEPMPQQQVITPPSQPSGAPAQNGVKTPQQLLQELQQMHQQQEQQQQQQNPQ